MSTPSENNATGAAAAAAPEAKEMTSKDYYFDSYSHFGIHEEMLRDEVRTRTYMHSMLKNKAVFEGKVVLDVGCGTGILSMFAAKAGAKHVYGVDCASIIEQAREIVAINGLADKVTLIRGKVEDISLPVDKVDIIISEWMGYFLLYESMLDTVLVARDRWLRPGGAIFPDKASLRIVTIEDSQYKDEKIDFWDNVYGFDMTPIKRLALAEPLVDVCEADQIISTSQEVLAVDIYTVTKEALDFHSDFSLEFQRSEYCHAVVGYFSVTFSKTHTGISFSTGPADRYTHWKQTVFYLEDALTVSKGDVLEGNMDVARNKSNPRDIDVVLRYRHVRLGHEEEDRAVPLKEQSYRIR